MSTFLERQSAGGEAEQDGMPAQQGRIEPLSRSRQVLADKMTASFRDIPQFSLRFQAAMDHTLVLLPQMHDPPDGKITINDLVVRATALAIARLPAVQFQYRSAGLYEPEDVNVAIAVAVDDDIIVPVLRETDRKNITHISSETAELIDRAKNRQLRPDDTAEGTFTVSNLGMFGITSFTPIVNPGQGAILGVGAMREIPVISGGAVESARVIELTLVCDHRAVNGATGAAFCQELKKVLETAEASVW